MTTTTTAVDSATAAAAAEAEAEGWATPATRPAFFAELLHAVIAEFDRLTGRTECHKFTAADWRRVKAALT